MQKFTHRLALSAFVMLASVGTATATKSLSISDVVWPTDKQVLADQTGTATFTVAFKATNTGDEIINPGDEGYSFIVGNFNFMGTMLYQVGEKAGDVSIAVGESVDVEVQCSRTLDDPAVDASVSLKIQEQFGKTTFPDWGQSIKILSPAAKLTLTQNGTAVSSGSTVDFGIFASSKTIEFTVGNTGRSALVVNGIDFGIDGVSTSAEFPFTVEPEATTSLQVTMAGATGGKKCAATLKYNDYVSDVEFPLSFKAGITEEGAYIEDFQSVTTPAFPGGWIARVGDNGSTSWQTKKLYGTDNIYANHGSSNNPCMLVSPLMNVTKSMSLSLQLGLENVTYNHGPLVVYYSTDRELWTELGKVEQRTSDGRLPFNTFNWETAANNELNWYNFALSKLEEGNYYFAFEGSYCMIDNIFGPKLATVDHDLVIDSFILDNPGMVNHRLQAAVTVTNYNSILDDSYTASLWEGEEKVADFEVLAIEPYQSMKLRASYTPHVLGDRTLVVKIEAGEQVLTASGNTVIAAEEALKSVQTGELEAMDAGEPFYNDDKIEYLQTILTPEEIGFAEGTEITRMAFIGYSTRTAPLQETVRICLEPTELTEFVDADKTAITLPGTETDVFSAKEYSFETKGNADSPATYGFDFDKPFIYGGGNLLLTFVRETTEFPNANLLLAYHTDETATRTRVEHGFTKTYTSKVLSHRVPTLKLYTPLEERIVSGTVVNKSEPVANAEIMLLSAAAAKAAVPDGDDVRYVATTDNDGYFAIPVIQSGRTYSLSLTDGNDICYTHTDLIEVPTDKDIDLGTINISTSGIDGAVSGSFNLSVNGCNLTVAATDAAMTIHTPDGRTVFAVVVRGEKTVTLAPGLYFVTIDGITDKVILK